MHKNYYNSWVIKLCLFTLLLFISSNSILAQSGTIRGQVFDKETGDPLVGANVIVMNTSRGSSADAEGQPRQRAYRPT